MQIISRITTLALFIFCVTCVHAQFHKVHIKNGESHNEMIIYESGYVDISPSFPGGECALIKFINKTRRYPVDAYNNKIQGRVVCRFVVHPDGSINAISIIKGVEDSLNQEAVRIIREMPKWTAGKLNDEPVPVYYVLTIPFRI